MRRISFRNSIWAVGLVAVMTAAIASAAPSPNSAVVNTRIFNDCFTSTLTVVNSYPGSISMNDDLNCTTGFANLHNWRFSENGTTEAVFNNGDSFRVSADLVVSGNGVAEAGFQVCPWWSQEVDGRFNVRIPDGEIACFGGRLPFYSFTGVYGLHYVAGTTINLVMCYVPNGNSEASPATIEYKCTIGGVTYTSGPKPFDSGNLSEDPPHGVWGVLNDARVGGHYQAIVNPAGPASTTAVWSNISYGECAFVGVEEATWGAVKHLFR